MPRRRSRKTKKPRKRGASEVDGVQAPRFPRETADQYENRVLKKQKKEPWTRVKEAVSPKRRKQLTKIKRTKAEAEGYRRKVLYRGELAPFEKELARKGVTRGKEVQIGPETFMTVHSGLHEIGGNQIELRHRDKSIFLDFGYSYDLARMFYSPPIFQPQKISELVNKGFVPRKANLYHKQWGEKEPHLGIKWNKKDSKVAGVFITHVHTDHSGHIDLLDHSIPIFMSPLSKTQIRFGQGLKSLRNTTKLRKHMNIRTIESGKSVEAGGFNVKAFAVDHTIPGSLAFKVTSPDGTKFLYTGDMRFTGLRAKDSFDMTKKAKKGGVDVLAMESTNLHEKTMVYRLQHENMEEVEDSIKNNFGKYPGALIYWKEPTDLDSLRMFLKVAKEMGRTPVIPAKAAANIYVFKNAKRMLNDKEYLQFVERIEKDEKLSPEQKKKLIKEKAAMIRTLPDITEMKDVMITMQRRPRTLKAEELKEQDFAELALKGRRSWYEKLIAQLVESGEIDRKRVIVGKENRLELFKDPEKYMLLTHQPDNLLRDLSDLLGIDPKHPDFPALLISGKQKLHLKYTRRRYNRTSAWALNLGADRTQAHTSGHLVPDHNRWIENEIRPKFSLLVHTLNPHAYDEEAHTPMNRDVILLPTHRDPDLPEPPGRIKGKDINPRKPPGAWVPAKMTLKQRVRSLIKKRKKKEEK
jgi:mRNA degradation ribonuclease J1/J2